MGDCDGYTLDVSVGEVTIALHGHGMLTPEVLDTLLARITRHATLADAQRVRALQVMQEG